MNTASVKVEPVSVQPDDAAANATRVVTDLLRCILWLLGNRISVTGFVGEKSNGVDRVVVTVAPAPRLHSILKDCAWRQRRQTGALTTYTWFAERFGIRIEWEETCA